MARWQVARLAVPSTLGTHRAAMARLASLPAPGISIAPILLVGCHLIFPLRDNGGDAGRRDDAGITDAAVDAGLDATPDASGGGCTQGCDVDGDGFCSGSEDCGGDDCDDQDPDVRPNADEIEDWSFETVGTGLGDPSLAVRNDRIWVAYSDASTVWAALRRGPDDWVEEAIVGRAAGPGSLSIATDGDGGAHVAFYDPVDTSLWYAHRIDDDRWSAEELSAGGLDAGKDCSLALDSFGSPRIAYFVADAESQGALHLSRRTEDGGLPSWTTEEVLNTEGAVPSLAIEADGTSRILVSDGQGDLYLLTKRAVWESVPFGPATRSFAPLVLGEGDVEHLAFSGWNEIVHAPGPGGLFDLEHVMFGEGQVSLALDGDDRPHVAVIRQDPSLVYSWRRAGVWSDPEVVDDGAMGQPTIRVANRRIHIAYLADDGDMIYAFRSIEDDVDDDCDGAVR